MESRDVETNLWGDEGERMKYHTQKVEIVINKEDELWSKLVERAAEYDMAVEELIDMLVTVGIYHELERKLK